MKVDQFGLFLILKRRGVVRSILWIIAITWLSLMILSLFVRGEMTLDIATHVRFLFGLPCLILSSLFITRKINWMLAHFETASLMEKEEVSKINSIIQKNRRFFNSPWTLGLIIIMSYAIVLLSQTQASLLILDWRSLDTPLGWWFLLVSMPFNYFVIINFILIMMNWWMMMFSIARHPLKLSGANGDGVAGLGFLSTVLDSFFLPAFTLSSMSAAGASNLIRFGPLTFEGLHSIFALYISLVTLVFVGPLLFFLRPLLKIREASIHAYGVLTSHQLADFHKRWLQESPPQDKLTVGDFSAVTDNGSEISRVHEMKLIPIKLRDLAALFICMALPFIPVFSLEMPWSELFQLVFGLLH